jgi:membrane protease YdiL (CAAX protease family)
MNESPPEDSYSRAELLKLAAVAYSVLAMIAVGLDALAATELRSSIRPSLWSFGLGLLAVIPMAPAYFLATGLRDRVVDLLGRPLSRCGILDLTLLALLAGTCEELLFRGALEAWWARLNPWFGIIATNLLFGLCHALTPSYFVIATGFGVYFSVLARSDDPRNLVAPMTAHAVYDLIGFILIAREYRRKNPTDV